MARRRLLFLPATCAAAAVACACGDDPTPASATADVAATADTNPSPDLAPQAEIVGETAEPDTAAAEVAADAVDGTGQAETAPTDVAPPQCQAPTDCPPTGNPCVHPACTAAGQCATVSADGLGCDDGQPCTIAAFCTAGKCVAKLSAACECVANADCKPLEDADLCNGTLYCDKQAFPFHCKVNPATIVSCDPAADSACTKTVCAPKTGACTPTAVELAKQKCTAGKGCAWFAKEPGEVTATVACEDGNKCTTGDFCAAGACVAGSDTCSCKTNADCADQDDGNLCNGALFCNKALNPPQCQLNPATVVVCPNAFDTACAKNACSPATGSCGMAPTEQAKATCKGADCQYELLPPGQTVSALGCDDGNACTAGDLCGGGKCAPGTDTCICKSDADCKGQDDGNLCNGVLFCNLASKKCAPNPATAVTCPTAGDSACTKNACVPLSGACTPTETGATEIVCTPFPDGSQHCQRQVSSKPLVQKIGCEDGDPCTAGDVCEKGQCKAGKEACPCKADADCADKDDGNLCNGKQFCNLASGQCVWNPATVVQCPSVDNTTCKKTACHPKTGQCFAVEAKEAKQVCEKLPNGQAPCLWVVKAPGDPMPLVECDDGNPCTNNDTCVGGNCAAGTLVCECQTHADCATKDDGDLCNGSWYCDKTGDKPACKPNPAGAVVCGDQPKNKCLKKACEPKSGQCLLAIANEGGACDDDDPCTLSDACTAGTCDGKPNPCDDGNLCTQDLCKTVTGCGHAKANCDDGNACTLDVCNPKTGQCDLQAQPMDGKPCDADDNTCTPIDLCGAGTCKAGASIVCKLATGPCEAAVCVNGKASFSCAVVAKAEGAACADGDTCTIGATCSKGQCAPGTAERFFAKEAGAPGKHSEINGIASVDNGEVVVAGGVWTGSVSQPAESTWWFSRLDRLGKPVWQHESPMPTASPFARAFAVTAVGDGSAIAVGGATTAQAGLNAQVARADVKGNLLWSKDFGQANADEVARAVAASASGAPVAVGWRKSGTTNEAWALRLTSAGSYVWDVVLSTGGGEARAVHLGDDGTLAVAGWQVVGGKPVGRLWSLSAEGKLGNLSTQVVLTGAVRFEAFSPTAGGWLVAGTVGDGAAARATWWRLDGAGKTVWQRQTKVASAAHALLPGPGGNWLLAGMTDASGGNTDAWLAAIDGLGNAQWARDLDGGGADRAHTLAWTSDGGLAAAGLRVSGAIQRALLVRSDGFGHASCAAAGACMGKPPQACADGKACTADDCHATAGCQSLAVDAFACDPQDGCSLDGQCASGSCKPGAVGRLYEKALPFGAGLAFGAVATDEAGATWAVGHDTAGPPPHRWRLFPLDVAGNLGASTIIATGKQFNNNAYPVEVAAAVARGGGGLIVGGSAVESVSPWMARIVGTAASGAPAWELKEFFSNAGSARLHDLVSSSDGTVTALCDYKFGFGLLRVKASGQVVWKTEEPGNAALEQRLQRATFVQGGHLLGGGTARATLAGPLEFAVTRLDGGGAVQWTRFIALPFVPAAALANPSSVDFWGALATAQGSRPARMRVAFDGSLLGVYRYGDANATVDVAAAVIRAGGDVLLAGRKWQGQAPSAWMGVVTGSGELAWQRTWKLGLGTGLSTAGALLALPNGDAIAVGTAVISGVDQGYVQRTDTWGHASCPALGSCALVPSTACDDGKPCTAGRCEGALGCVQGPAGCDDGNPCTNDACLINTGCTHNAGCNDGDGCTLDTCDPAGGCKHAVATCAGKPCAPSQCAAVSCTGAWFNGRCWHANANASSWQAARTACEAQGRHLASIHSLAENQFVAALVGASKSTIFIGLHNPSGDVTQYQWTDGSPVDFALWGYNGLPTKSGAAYLQASGAYVWLVGVSSTFGGAYVCTGL